MRQLLSLVLVGCLSENVIRQCGAANTGGSRPFKAALAEVKKSAPGRMPAAARIGGPHTNVLAATGH
jgi:hypothetical protein